MSGAGPGVPALSIAAARAAPAAPPVPGRGGDQSHQELARPLPAPRAASPIRLCSGTSMPGSERLPAELLLRRSPQAPPASALQAGSHLLGKTAPPPHLARQFLPCLPASLPREGPHSLGPSCPWLLVSPSTLFRQSCLYPRTGRQTSRLVPGALLLGQPEA